MSSNVGSTPKSTLPAVEIVEGSSPATVRSPADLLRLAVAVVLLVVILILQWLSGDTLTTFATELLQGVGAIPTWILDVFVIGVLVLTVVGFAAGLLVTLRHGRWRELLTVGLSVAIALVIVFLFDQFSPDSTVSVIELHDVGPLTSAGLPAAAGVAIASAALTAAAPWLQRRRRQLGWVLVLGLGFTQFLVTAIRSTRCGPSSSAGWPAPPPWSSSEAPSGARPDRPSPTAWPRWGCRCSDWSAPAWTPAARPPTSGSRPTARSSS